MKKISCIISLIYFCTQVNAQTSNRLVTDTTDISKNKLFTQGRTSVGIKAEFIQSNFYGNDLSLLSTDGKSSTLNGFSIGITANSMISKYVWLKHELMYMQSGAKIIVSDSMNGNYNSNLKMQSLYATPVSPAFHFKGFQLYAGPYVSALLNASIIRKNNSGKEFTDKSIYGNGVENTEFNKYLQKFDFGIAAGIAYEFTFGLNIGIGYTRGFVSIFDNANVNTFGQDNPEIKIYNERFNISIGYSFLKKCRDNN